MEEMRRRKGVVQGEQEMSRCPCRKYPLSHFAVLCHLLCPRPACFNTVDSALFTGMPALQTPLIPTAYLWFASQHGQLLCASSCSEGYQACGRIVNHHQEYNVTRCTTFPAGDYFMSDFDHVHVWSHSRQADVIGHRTPSSNPLCPQAGAPKHGVQLLFRNKGG